LVPWKQFLGFKKVKKFGLRDVSCWSKGINNYPHPDPELEFLKKSLWGLGTDEE
jgi:hypothetical protein